MKKTLKTLSFFATFAVIFFVSTANIFAQKQKPKPTAKTKKPAIAANSPKVTQIDDATVKEILKPKNGKPLLVNFWATWCVPCRQEFPELVEIDKEYKGKIDFITISLDDLAEINRDVPKFLIEMKATMPAYLLKTNDENAVIGAISKDWAGGLPFSVLYDKDGNVVYSIQGKVNPEIVKEKINGLCSDADQIIELPTTHSIYTFEKGMEDAKKDIAVSTYKILRFGFGSGSAEEINTLKDKYDIEIKDYGCVVPSEIVAYIKGYNEISKAELKRKFGKEF